MPIALLSVWDKTGLTEFAAQLHARDWTLLASGGTARALEAAGLPVTPVAEITGEPEMLAGRVKTLHPAVHAGLLARDTPGDRAALAARGWHPIDLAAVNLYPFEDTASAEEVDSVAAVEMIDVGGVAILRAAAKNHARVTVLCDPADYPAALDPPDPAAFRLRMAYKAFARTADYDDAIRRFFAARLDRREPLELRLYATLPLRYGENPHQEAAYFSPRPGGFPFGGQLLQGKPLSYNNLLDLDAAWDAALGFEEPAVAVVKHLSPCGIAVAPTVAGALGPARASDPISAFGSVIAANRPVDTDFVDALDDLFVECLIAPAFTAAAREALSARSNLQLLQVHPGGGRERTDLRSAAGGFLRQSADRGDPPEATWRVVSRRQPEEAERAVLRFAWRAVRPVRSNAVLLARPEGDALATVGIGGGQPNRLDCVRVAGERAGERAAGAVLASDAFFPFPDGIERAAAIGVRAVIQPGGSIRDEAVIAAADSAGMAMVFTGVRHFRH